jgi:hypothetical protein
VRPLSGLAASWAGPNDPRLAGSALELHKSAYSARQVASQYRLGIARALFGRIPLVTWVTGMRFGRPARGSATRLAEYRESATARD